MEDVRKFIKDQLSVWPVASANFRSLKTASYRDFTIGGIAVKAQHNPCRIASTTADVSNEGLAARPCFLCVEHRPAEQFHIKFDGRKSRRYNVQVNPYPIFPEHLVIARDEHVPQSIWHYFVDMMDFARKYPSYLVFYNGPQSGASAPDHFHFQSCPKDSLPLQVAVDAFLDDPMTQPLTVQQDARIYHYPHFCRGVYALKADTPKSLAKLFYRLVDCAPFADGDPEPHLNLFIYCHRSEFRCIVTLRSELRSHHYFSDGDDHLTMTFGAADMAGMFVCPRKEDFDKLTPALLEEVLDEVTISAEEEEMVAQRLTRTQSVIEVGVYRGEQIEFEMISDGAGPQKVSLRDGRIDYNGMLYDELFFDRRTRSTLFAEPSFILSPQQDPLYFAGSLKITTENGKLVAVNLIGIENYLLSALSYALKDRPGLTVEEAVELSISWRDEVLFSGKPIPEYFGLTFEISPVVRKALDISWGKTNH